LAAGAAGRIRYLDLGRVALSIRNRFSSLAAVVIAAGFAIGTQAPIANGAVTRPGGKPVRGGTVVIAIGTDATSLLPYNSGATVNSDAVGLIFMQLADTEPDFEHFIPQIGKSWDWSPDHRVLTMHLRDDVRWHDGVPVTAEDVQFTFEVARDSVVGWLSRSWKSHIQSCEVVDPYTVRYRFDGVYLEQVRDAKEGLILPKHLLKDVPRTAWATAEFGRHPVGCGPFKFESWEHQQRIVLVRNDDYFEKGKPYLDRVVFEIVPEPSTRLAQLRSGMIDLMEQVPNRDAVELRKEFEAGKSDVRIVSYRGRFYDFIGYNRLDPLFTSRKVREALTRAIDRKAIIDGLCYGFGEPIESPIIPILWAHDPKQPITPYDPAGARKLLADEGWRDTDGDGVLDKDGKPFEFTLLTNQDNDLRVKALVPVQRDWKAIGVKADVRTLDLQTVVKLRTGREYQAVLGGWRSGIKVDLDPIWGCAHLKERNNFVSFCDPRVDSLNALAVRLTPELARPLFFEAQRLVARDYPYTWLYYIDDILAVNTRVHGAVMDSRGPYNNVESWWIPAEQQKPGAGR
jgi:peptide/nickel transport system substrate-binding protein